MRANAWLWFLAGAALEVAILVGAAMALWTQLLPEERAVLEMIWVRQPGVPILAGFALLLLLGVGVHLIFKWYVDPVRTVAEEVRLIAIGNSAHRLSAQARPAVQDLIAGINLLAERYQSTQQDVLAQIAKANAAIEEERNTLAALISHLTQGVLVCNPEGRILLYNQRARALMEASGQTMSSNWIGLGRSVYSVMDKKRITHALLNIEQNLRHGETRLMTAFAISRPDGKLLNVHLMPVLDNDVDRNVRGYVFILEDITRRIGVESRRSSLLRSLTEGQRSAIAGIRAAIETVLSYPDMDNARRHEFLEAIRGEALKVSEDLDRLESEYGQDIKDHGPFEDTLGTDLLATLERQLADGGEYALEINAPVEPLWIRLDSYAICQCVQFLIDQLVEACRARHFRLTLEHRRSLAALVLEWEGAPLHTEALKFWGTTRNVLPAAQGTSSTLFDIIERHGGAIWSHRTSASGCPSLRLILPVSDQEPSHEDARLAAQFTQAFDFELFRTTTRAQDLHHLALNKLTCTVIDTETTGLAPSQGDEIIAIAAVRIVNGRILHQEVFDCLVDPRRPVADSAQAVHGLSSDMLRGMPVIEEVLPRFHYFIEDTVIVGHNVAFDLRFFELKEETTGIRFNNPVLDTMLLGSIVHPQHQDNTLEALAGRFGITVTGRHTALGDALTTAAVFLAMIPLLAEHGVHTLQDAEIACEQTPYARIKY
ncbi:MAG: exonuclease domain-containing protein [Hyphomicrobium sp.]